jgi:hypothetical protein
MARADHQWMSIRKLVRAAGEGYAYDPGSLFDKMNRSQALDPLPLRLLSIAGGILSAVLFTGSLLFSNLLNDGLPSLVTGICLMLVSILLPKWRNTLAFDTFAVALQAAGMVITAIGLSNLGWNGKQMAPLFAGIAFLTAMVTLSKTQAFTSVILFFGSLLFGLEQAGWQDGLHLYNLLTIATVTTLMLSESWALSRGGRLLWLYLPLRNGVIIATFTGFVLLAGGDNTLWKSPRLIWLSYLPVAVALLMLVRHVSMELLDADRKRRNKWMIALLLLTLPTAMNPAIAGSMLILLLGFYTGHRSAFVLGALGLPLFIGMWYYDLPISLLQKSIWMMVSGAACMLTYLFLVFINKEDAEG